MRTHMSERKAKRPRNGGTIAPYDVGCVRNHSREGTNEDLVLFPQHCADCFLRGKPRDPRDGFSEGA